MNLLGRKALSYFLLLCIAVSTFPWDLLHHHKDEFKSIQSEETLDSYACYNSVLFPDVIEFLDCDHKQHLDKEDEPCELCDLFTSRHHNFFDGISYYFHQIEILEERISFEPPLYINCVESAINSRGPPA